MGSALHLSTPTKPDRSFPTSNSDRPLITNKTRSPKSQHQTAIAPHLSTSPIAYFPQHQNSDLPPHHPTPDRLFPHIKQRSPLTTHKPDRLNLNIKLRSPLITIKTRSPIHPNQTAIAPHHPKPDRLYLLASFELELGNVDLFYDLEIKYASIP